MAKEREYITFEYESMILPLPLKIRQGEHRRIERLTIQLASQDYKEMKDQIGDAFDSIETQTSDESQPPENDDEMSDLEVTAMLIVLGDMSQEEVDDIGREDFLAIKAELETLYKKKTNAEREFGKKDSESNLKKSQGGKQATDQELSLNTAEQ